jgi:uncharacterized membrane protein
MSAWWFWILRFSRRLLVRASAYGAFAVLAALAAVWFAPFVPRELSERLGGDAVEGVLTALASSLLAVATFSLSAMVVAYTAASAQLTPRAATFVTTDGATQGALATFVGAFIFTIVALVALGANYYGAEGRTILFIATLVMVTLVAVRLIGWIDHVSRLAQHGHILSKIEDAARASLRARGARRYLGGKPLKTPSAKGMRVPAVRTGYIANIDPGTLQKIAQRVDATIEVLVSPGDFVVRGAPLVNVVGARALTDEGRSAICSAFTSSPARTIEQDPVYAMQILVEVAARALSPGVNDPGTAILVVDSLYRLLEEWVLDDKSGAERAEHDRLRARDMDGRTLIARSLGDVGRYGAGDVAVATRVQAALAALARACEGDLARYARMEAEIALERAERALPLDLDRECVRAAVNAN